MVKIKDVKQELRHREWAEQIQECQNSGMTVKEWCRRKEISPNTYYTRLRKIREEMLARQPELQSIVPVSISAEIANEERNIPEKIIIRKDGIEIEIPQDSGEHTILALLKGIRQC